MLVRWQWSEACCVTFAVALRGGRPMCVEVKVVGIEVATRDGEEVWRDAQVDRVR